jgi:hypothetical protein
VNSSVFWTEKNAASKRKVSRVYLFSTMHRSEEKRNTEPKFPKTKTVFSCVRANNLQMHFEDQSLLFLVVSLKPTVF